jgi:hypothetical protein
MVRDAIEMVLEERRERGEAIPQTGWALVEAVEIGRTPRPPPRASRYAGTPASRTERSPSASPRSTITAVAGFPGHSWSPPRGVT